MVKMKLSEIKISNAFTATTPKDDKLNACRNYWKENHEQDRAIVVNKNNVLIDGYIMYLVLKENNVKYAEIKPCNKRMGKNFSSNVRRYEKGFHCRPEHKRKTTTYIFGVHPNAKYVKEYVWRVPASWEGWENDLLPGDRIWVHTEYGIKPIIITRIEWLDKCPVDMRVKKVYRKVMK